MAQKQKIYNAELKREAVRLLETSGKNGTRIAQELGISEGSLYIWRKQLAEQGEVAFPGKGHQPRPKKSCASCGSRMNGFVKSEIFKKP